MHYWENTSLPGFLLLLQDFKASVKTVSLYLNKSTNNQQLTQRFYGNEMCNVSVH